LVLVVALGACAPEVPVVPRAPAPAVPVEHRAAPFAVTDPLDVDTDGIPDQLENYLIAQFAPEVRLAPDRADWTRPANVDWYLPQVRLRFAHRMCRDHEVLSPGMVTADSIWRQAHPTESWTCSHTNHVAHSDAGATYERNRGFFLRPASKSTYRGIPVARSDEWRVYAHVQPSSYVRPSDHHAAAYDIQVWFFYAYNLGSMGFNHEADWEHVTISVSSDLEFVSAYYSAHQGGVRIDRASDLAWMDATHPIVYSARGTHASYTTAGAHRTPAIVDWTYDGGPRWQTWKNFINLGERDHVLGGQDWARYDGRWGHPGWFEVTSGPVGPMFNGRWSIAGTEYPHPAMAKTTTARTLRAH
jgi:hypothetical protein